MRERKRRRTKKPAMGENNVPDAELETLACLWRLEEATARQIRDTMHSYRPLSPSSVTTLLGRLMARGLASRRKGPVGKAFLYRASRPARLGHTKVLRDLLHRVFAGDTMAMVVPLLKAKPLSTREIEELKQLLDELIQEEGERK